MSKLKLSGLTISAKLGPLSIQRFKKVAQNEQVLALSESLPGEWAPFSYSSSGGLVPDNVGDLSLNMYNETVIARFLTPLFCEHTNQTYVSVFAYAGGYVGANQRNTIDRVEFYANGGASVTVTSPTTDENGNEVYRCPVSSQWSGKVAEIRAVVYPSVGKPRILQGPWFDTGYIGDPLESRTTIIDRFHNRGAFICQWDSVWYVDQWNSPPGATGQTPQDPLPSVTAVLTESSASLASDIKVILLGSGASTRYRVNADLLPQIGAIDPKNGTLPLKLSGGILELSSGETARSNIGSVIFADCEIRQNPSGPARFVLPSTNGTAYYQLENFVAGYEQESHLFTAAAVSAPDESEFLPINNVGLTVNYIMSIFDFEADLVDLPFHHEAVNGVIRRTMGDSCNARGLAVNLTSHDVCKWTYPMGSVNANGDGTPSAATVLAEYNAGTPLDLGAWPDATQADLHTDVLQIEDDFMSNVVIYRVNSTQTFSGISSAAGLFISDNVTMYDIVIKDCQQWPRDSSTAQWGVTVGGPWGSALGNNISHNAHLENVSSVSVRVGNRSLWSSQNSFWIGGREINADTGVVTSDRIYSGSDRADGVLVEIPQVIDGGFVFVPEDADTAWSDPAIPEDWTGFV